MGINMESLSDAAILELVGNRLREWRLLRNRSVDWVAGQAQIDPRTVRALEQGRGRIENLVPVLRALRLLDSLNAFLPEPPPSPIDLARREGRERKRAYRKSGPRKTEETRKKEEPKW